VSCFGLNSKSAFDKVLHANLVNVCVPQVSHLPQELLEHVMLFILTAKKLSSLLDCTVVCQSNTKTPLLFSNPALNKILKIIESFGLSSSTMIVRMLDQIDKFCSKFVAPPRIPSAWEVIEVKRKLGDLIVFGKPDKNNGILDIFCPSVLWSFLKTKIWDNQHFPKKPDLNESGQIQYFCKSFDSNIWHLVGNFKNSGTLPYFYIQRKFKDVSRVRGFFSYFNHPLKIVYFRAAVGFTL
jgi:hypothetical protein